MINGKNEDVAIDGRQDHPLLPTGMRRLRIVGDEWQVVYAEVFAGLPEQDTAVAINAATLRVFRACPVPILLHHLRLQPPLHQCRIDR